MRTASVVCAGSVMTMQKSHRNDTPSLREAPWRRAAVRLGSRRGSAGAVALAVVAVVATAGLAVGAYSYGFSDGGSTPPGVPAVDEAQAGAGEVLFQGSCGSCHTLKAAGTVGQVGPALDGLGTNAAGVLGFISNGAGVMPAELLSGSEAEAVAEYVARMAEKS